MHDFTKQIKNSSLTPLVPRTRVDDAARASAWRYPAVHVDAKGRLHVVWMDDRDGQGALYHAYSDDGGASFSANTRITDQPFPFPADAPPPPPATQSGMWIGDYLAVTSVGDRVIVAWSGQRTGLTKAVVRVAVGEIQQPKQIGTERMNASVSEGMA